MKRYLFLIILLCSVRAKGQGLIPHPYVFAGPEGMGGGYSPIAVLGGGGFRVDSKHLIVDANGWYDNGHKTNDNDQPNPGGHDRGLVGSTYYRFASGWAFGGGARWSQFASTNYTKASWRPTFGGSRDFFVKDCLAEGCRKDFTMRIGADYLTKGSDWQNGTQGPLITFYLPSPTASRHVFYRQAFGCYVYHDTVTDRADPVLTRAESSSHSVTSFIEWTLMYRF